METIVKEIEMIKKRKANIQNQNGNKQKKSQYILACFLLCLPLLAGCTHREKISRNAEETTKQEILSDLETQVQTETAHHEGDTGQTEIVSANTETEKEEETSTANAQNVQNGSDVVTLSFVGDIFLSPIMYSHYQQSGISGVISPKIQNIFQSVDIAAGDHEYVCGDLPESLKVSYQQYTFLTPTSQEALIADFGFEVMTLANNHMMDYGITGLLSTMEELHKYGIATIGGGSNLAEALKPYTAVVNGKKIAILSATRVVPQTDWYAAETTAGLMTTYESTDRYITLKDEIARLKAEEGYDIVIMYVHWGNDSDKTILNSQTALGHGYIDAGADIVIGNHTHVLQGMEFYQGKLICYGLSNFLFGSYHSDTMVLTLEINKQNQITAKMLPCTSENFYTQELEGDAAQNMFRYIESMSSNVAITEDGTITEIAR